MPPRRRMLITAGPTHEPIDAVRFVGNRSSGRLGVCLATAARDAGWDVTLLLGPAAASPPDGVRTIRFESSSELAALLDEHFPDCDLLIMAAAVADYRPRRTGAAKLPRTDQPLVLELEPTPDLVAACARRKRPGQRIIGFALEDPAVLAPRALKKLRRKDLDAIIANPLATMGSPVIQARVFAAAGQTRALPAPAGGTAGAPKLEFARALLAWIEATWYT